jgi:hypothetical protein
VTGPERVHLRVVGGRPTAEEVAALSVALSAAARARAAGAAADRPAGGGRAPVGGWAWRGRLLRTPLAHGPDAWRRSALPS